MLKKKTLAIRKQSDDMKAKHSLRAGGRRLKNTLLGKLRKSEYGLDIRK